MLAEIYLAHLRNQVHANAVTRTTSPSLMVRFIAFVLPRP